MYKSTKGQEKHYIPGKMRDDRPENRLLMAKVHRPLVDQAGIQPGHGVLEIGCGTGNLLLLSKRLHPDAEMVGIDPDPEALSRARQKSEQETLPIQLDRGFAEELPYPDASFDRMLSAFMFHHLGPEEKEETLREVRRVLKPGGSLHLLDHGASILTLMRKAGLADPAEIAYRFKRGMGHLTYYRATAPLRELEDGG